MSVFTMSDVGSLALQSCCLRDSNYSSPFPLPKMSSSRSLLAFRDGQSSMDLENVTKRLYCTCGMDRVRSPQIHLHVTTASNSRQDPASQGCSFPVVDQMAPS